jgi:hypothetical protein
MDNSTLEELGSNAKCDRCHRDMPVDLGSWQGKEFLCPRCAEAARAGRGSARAAQPEIPARFAAQDELETRRFFARSVKKVLIGCAVFFLIGALICALYATSVANETRIALIASSITGFFGAASWLGLAAIVDMLLAIHEK